MVSPELSSSPEAPLWPWREAGRASEASEGPSLLLVNQGLGHFQALLESSVLSWAAIHLASGIPECQFSEALKSGGTEAPLSFHHGILEGESYLIPKDRVGLIATHRQGIPLQTEVHRSIMIPDIGHVLEGKAERPQVSSSPLALVPMPWSRSSSGWTCVTFSYTGDEQGRRQAERDRNPSKRPGSFVSSNHSVRVRDGFQKHCHSCNN